MVISRGKITGGLFLLVILIQSCKEQNVHSSDIEIIELLKANNKCIHISNKSIINLLSKDTLNKVNLDLFKGFGNDVYGYFNSFRSDFIFELENGKKKFFDADTIKTIQIKNWNDKAFISKYNELSIDSLRSGINILNTTIKSFPSSKYYFDEKKIVSLLDELINKENNAYDVLKVIEMIKNNYLISLNTIISNKIK